jgi:hypothetical protein
MFKTYMRENVVMANVKNYVDFIKHFTFPTEEDSEIWHKNKHPLIKITLKINSNA